MSSKTLIRFLSPSTSNNRYQARDYCRRCTDEFNYENKKKERLQKRETIEAAQVQAPTRLPNPIPVLAEAYVAHSAGGRVIRFLSATTEVGFGDSSLPIPGNFFLLEPGVPESVVRELVLATPGSDVDEMMNLLIQGAVQKSKLVKGFLAWARGKSSTPDVALRFSRIYGLEDTILETLKDFSLQDYSSSDKAKILLEVLKTTERHKQKALIASMVLALDERTFLDEYLVAVLDGSSYFEVENQENNINFVKAFLKTVDRRDLIYTLENIDYNKVSNVTNFVKSLVSVGRHNDVLEGLVNCYERLRSNAETKYHNERLEEIIIRFIEQLKSTDVDVDFKYLEHLYKDSDFDSDQLKRVTELINRSNSATDEEKSNFYFRVVTSSDDEVSNFRKHYALWSYSSIKSERTLRGLRYLAESDFSEDVKAYSSFLLLRAQINGGRKEFIDLVKKQITEGEYSLAFSMLLSLIQKKSSQYSDRGVMDEILSGQFPKYSISNYFRDYRRDNIPLPEIDVEGKTRFKWDFTTDCIGRESLDISANAFVGVITLRHLASLALKGQNQNQNVKELCQAARESDEREFQVMYTATLASRLDPNERRFLEGCVQTSV